MSRAKVGIKSHGGLGNIKHADPLRQVGKLQLVLTLKKSIVTDKTAQWKTPFIRSYICKLNPEANLRLYRAIITWLYLSLCKVSGINWGVLKAIARFPGTNHQVSRSNCNVSWEAIVKSYPHVHGSGPILTSSIGD